VLSFNPDILPKLLDLSIARKSETTLILIFHLSELGTDLDSISYFLYILSVQSVLVSILASHSAIAVKLILLTRKYTDTILSL